MTGEPARDAAQHAPFGAAVQLAQRWFVRRFGGGGACGAGRGDWHGSIVTCTGWCGHQGNPWFPRAKSGIGQGRRGPHRHGTTVTMDV